MTEVSDIIDEFMLILRSGKRKTKEIMFIFYFIKHNRLTSRYFLDFIDDSSELF